MSRIKYIAAASLFVSLMFCGASFAEDVTVWTSKGTPGLAESQAKSTNVKKKQLGDPTFPPQKNEYYPINNKKFPHAITNPNAHTRNITFKGAPLDIFTKLNMVSQVVLPSTPVLINIGKPEAFSVETVPEFNSIFIKPMREVEITNLIVTCENGGVYLFILKDNPYVPWDIRCQILDPYKQVKPADAQSLIQMLYIGKRLPDFQYTAMDLRTPNASAYVYDPLTQMGCRIVLKRALAMPASGKSGYWIEFENIAPPKSTLPAASYTISEKSIWTPKLTKVAVPGYRNGDSFPMLAKGDKVPVFLLLNSGQIPPIFKFRFALNGSRNLPIDVALPTNHGHSKAIEARKTTDDRLKAEYEELVRQGKIQPMTEEDLKILTEQQNKEIEKQNQQYTENAENAGNTAVSNGQQSQQNSTASEPPKMPDVPAVIAFPQAQDSK